MGIIENKTARAVRSKALSIPKTRKPIPAKIP